nr:MltA domain-containing protein [Planctomycetota bacterium]
MTLRQLLVLVLLPLALIPTEGCRRGRKKETAKDYNHQLLPGEQALVEVDTAQLPMLALTAADRTALRTGIAYSLTFLAKPAADAYYPIGEITKDQAVRSLQALRGLLDGTPDDVELNRAIRAQFRALMSVGCDGQGTVLFTGYYTPIFTGSLTPDARYRFPIHKRPADLQKVGNDTMALQRMPDGSTRPYPPRGELMRGGALKGLELVYFADEFEAYIVQVQGSGKIRLTSGEMIDVGYDGTNGHEYHKIADDLIADGKITREELSLGTMRAYFNTHPEEVRTYVERNPRMIFFTRTKGGPYGSLGQPVTTHVSVATDKKI